MYDAGGIRLRVQNVPVVIHKRGDICRNSGNVPFIAGRQIVYPGCFRRIVKVIDVPAAFAQNAHIRIPSYCGNRSRLQVKALKDINPVIDRIPAVIGKCQLFHRYAGKVNGSSIGRYSDKCHQPSLNVVFTLVRKNVYAFELETWFPAACRDHSIIAQAKNVLAGSLTIPDSPGFAAAYYYCEEHRCNLQYQGPGKHYCPVGKEYREKDFAGVNLDRDHATSLHEQFGRNVRALALAYVLTGDAQFSKATLNILEQYTAKYFTWDWMDLDTSAETIDKGRMEFAKYMECYIFRNMLEGLEFLRASGGVEEARARAIENGFLLPALSEAADFRMDMICRETSIVMTAFTGALAYGNAPLAAFCVDSPFGYWSLRRYGATGDGLVFGHGYAQNHFAGNMLAMAEMMYRNGRD